MNDFWICMTAAFASMLVFTAIIGVLSPTSKIIEFWRALCLWPLAFILVPAMFAAMVAGLACLVALVLQKTSDSLFKLSEKWMELSFALNGKLRQLAKKDK